MDSVRSQPLSVVAEEEAPSFFSHSDTLKLKDGKIQIAPPSLCVELTLEDQFELVL